MALQKTRRKKCGKTLGYWSAVENKRVADGRVVQCHMLYLREIISAQVTVWRKAIEVLDNGFLSSGWRPPHGMASRRFKGTTINGSYAEYANAPALNVAVIESDPRHVTANEEQIRRVLEKCADATRRNDRIEA